MLPILSGKEIVKIFESLGWEVSKQRGSHIIMIKQGEINYAVSSKPLRSGARNFAKFDSLGKFDD